MLLVMKLDQYMGSVPDAERTASGDTHSHLLFSKMSCQLVYI